MTRMRFGLAAAASLAVSALLLVVGSARTQGGATEKVLPVLSTSDVIGYVNPCG